MQSQGTEVELLKLKYAEVVDSLFCKQVRLKPLLAGDDASAVITEERMMSQLRDLSDKLDNLRAKIPSGCLSRWRRHTSFTHPLRSFVRERLRNNACRIEYSTQAFFKFYEILTRFSNLCFPVDGNERTLRTLHLCESPGAFISALNVYLKLQKADVSWYWNANSLNPHHEWNSPFDMFLDDELITSTYSNWLFSPDNSGDIFKWTNEYISNIAAKNGKFHLITADGSKYCQDSPAEQERSILPLLQKQVDISLSLLQTHGTFIMKMYTAFLDDTVALMRRLLECFGEVHAVKPSCSKPGNSEIYLLCADYTPCEQSGERLELLASYRKALLAPSEFFTFHQMQMIEFNIAAFNKVEEDDLRDFIEQKKLQAAEMYEKKMNLSDFEKFATSLSSASYTTRKRPNPWKFTKLSGFIEELRNITREDVQGLVEDMAVQDLMSGENTAAEQKFHISPCWICDSCQWHADSRVSSWNLEDILEIGDAPSGTFEIKHTIFLKPKIMAALKCACLDIRDMCINLDPNVTDFGSGSLEWFPNPMTAGSTNSFSLKSQLDWISVLEEMLRHESLHQDSAVQIKIPSSCLILTRFTASFLAFCSLCFESVVFLCPGETSSETLSNQLICRNPRSDIRNRLELIRCLSVIRGRLTGEAALRPHVYRFIPECQLGCAQFYESIVRYNRCIARRLLAKYKL